MLTEKHTPTPWEFEIIDGMPMITDGHDAIACRTHCYASADNENLKFIVEAVNTHEALVQENEKLKAKADLLDEMTLCMETMFMLFDWKISGECISMLPNKKTEPLKWAKQFAKSRKALKKAKDIGGNND